MNKENNNYFYFRYTFIRMLIQIFKRADRRTQAQENYPNLMPPFKMIWQGTEYDFQTRFGAPHYDVPASLLKRIAKRMGSGNYMINSVIGGGYGNIYANSFHATPESVKRRIFTN